MALIGDLVANMKVNSSAWASGLNRSRGKLDKFEKSTSSSMSRMSAGFAKLAAVAGAAFASAQLVNGIRGAADNIARMGKFAVQTGESVEKLSAISFAASQSGVDIDDLVGSMEELNIRMGETIQSGIGPAADAFRAMGIDASKLESMMPVERIMMLADEINNLSSETQRGFMTDEIFGGDGFKMLPLLRQGSGAIREMMDEAGRLGLVFDDIAVNKTRAANQAINKMQAAFGGVVNTLAIKLSPIILSVTNQFTEMGVSATNSTNQIGGSWRGLMRAIAFGADILGSFRLLWDQMAITATQGIGDILRDMKSLGDTISSVVNMIPGMSVKVPKSLDITIAAMDAMQSKMQRDLDNKMLGPSAGEKMMKDFDEAIEQAKRMQDQIAKPVEMPVMPMLNYAEFSDGLSRFFSPIGDAISGMFAGNDSGRSDNGDRAARLANTQEFFSTLYAAQRGSQADPQTKIQEHTKMAADILETASSTLQSIDQYLRDLTVAEAT